MMKKVFFIFYLISILLTAQQNGIEKIIFASYRDTAWNYPSLYMMDTDGSNINIVHPSAKSPILGDSPRISHDGNKIAYTGWDPFNITRNREIHVYDLTKKADRIVSLFEWIDGNYYPSNSDCAKPSWSPNDSLIVYTESGHWTPTVIYKVSSDTTSGFERTLLTNNLYGEWVSDWSVLDNKILFKTKFFNDSIFTYRELFTMDPDGSERVKLVNYPIIYYSTRYSPEEDLIAFISSYSTDSLGIYIIQRDGTNLQKLADIGKISHNFSPFLSWSPDGKKITYSTREQIYILNIETKETIQITNDNHWNYDPEWVTFYPTRVDETKRIIVENFELYQNYPNPFNPSTVIRYTIPKEVRGVRQEVRLVVYDVLGREVATLVNESKSAGSYEVEFKASGLTSGIYFYRLQSGSFSQTKKMLLIR